MLTMHSMLGSRVFAGHRVLNGRAFLLPASDSSNKYYCNDRC